MSNNNNNGPSESPSSPQQQDFFDNELPLATFFTSIYDVNFDAPLKFIADALHGISQASEFFFYSSSEQKQQQQQHKLRIVPSKLQIFKEKAFQAAGKKFGFVEFHIRSAQKENEHPNVVSNSNDNDETDREQSQDESASSSSSPSSSPKSATISIYKTFNDEKMQQGNLGLVNDQIDKVFAALSSASNLGLKLKRIPAAVVQQMQRSVLVSEAKDPLKILCFLSMRLERLRVDAESTIPSTNTNNNTNDGDNNNKNNNKNNVQLSSSSSFFFFIDDTPLSDMMLMRQEHPEKFPSPATADSVERFFVDFLGSTSAELEAAKDSLVLARRKEEGCRC